MTGMTNREGRGLGVYKISGVCRVTIGSDHLYASASSSYLLIVPNINDVAASREQVKFGGLEQLVGVVFRWGGPVTLNLPGIVLIE